MTKPQGETPASKDADHEDKRPYLDISHLSASDRRDLLENAAASLLRLLRSEEEREKGKLKLEDMLDEVGKSIGRKVNTNQLGNILKELYGDQYLRIGHLRLSERSDALTGKFGLRRVTVVAGRSEDRFAQAAAEDFIEVLRGVAQAKKQARKDGQDRSRGDALNIGIVSGSTIGAVIRVVTATNWSQERGIDWNFLPAKVRVFALNVCLTIPQHLPGNSTILAYQLAEKLSAETKGRSVVEAYGLSAPLLVAKQELGRIDAAPQTIDVVEHTEPYRVHEKIREKNGEGGAGTIQETDTELDLVLTGVGEKPPGDGLGNPESVSIFYDLAKQFEIDMTALERESRIVGDIAFTAIKSNGEPVPLMKGEEEYIFYSAVRIPVLEAMVRSPNKAVILVARAVPGKDKIPAIFASVGGFGSTGHRYASHLIVDEETATQLFHY